MRACVNPQSIFNILKSVYEKKFLYFERIEEHSKSHKQKNIRKISKWMKSSERKRVFFSFFVFLLNGNKCSINLINKREKSYSHLLLFAAKLLLLLRYWDLLLLPLLVIFCAIVTSAFVIINNISINVIRAHSFGEEFFFSFLVKTTEPKYWEGHGYEIYILYRS